MKYITYTGTRVDRRRVSQIKILDTVLRIVDYLEVCGIDNSIGKINNRVRKI